MALRYPSPRELVEALHERRAGARPQLWDLLHAPLTRLMGELAARHRLGRAPDLLTVHVLHAAETYLRTRPAHLFEGMTWPAFRAAILLHVAKLAAQPYGQHADRPALPGLLPQSAAYVSEALFLPCERVGGYWFGGDWFGGREADDGSLWVLVADITGHGYHAYLLASTLPGVWHSCWQAAPAQPADLLAAMHDLLEDCLPEGIYAECTLVRLGPEGDVVAAPAGGSRLLLRRGGGRPHLLTMRGMWLGLAAPSAADQHTWTLQEGDELLLATDGAFEQLTAQEEMLERLGASPAPLLASVRELLEQSLAGGPQKDDITVVMLRRRSRVEAPPAAAPPSPREAGDVPV